MEKVTVLLSTYNGEKYLAEQLDSIMNQKDVKVRLLVRDDGSSDSTSSILNTWSEKMELSWYSGNNLKPAKSFLDLLSNAGESSYYSFSDQDDYWLPEKLIAAIRALDNCKDVPALYFCQTQLVDEKLNKKKSIVINPYLTFGEALVYQFVSGCTMVFNSKLRDIVLSYKPSFVAMHDLWIYCIALAVGAKVIFDPQPHILYRQHENNVIGLSTNKYKEWKNRLFGLFDRKGNERYEFAREIQQGYLSQMTVENRATIDTFIKAKTSIKYRLKLFFDDSFKCSDKKTYRLFKLAVILNRY